jgi:hypothetical protein
VTNTTPSQQGSARLRAVDIEALALSTLGDAPTRLRPDHSPTDGCGSPLPARSPARAVVRWIAVTMILAGCGLATLYGDVWPGPSVSSDR